MNISRTIATVPVICAVCASGITAAEPAAKDKAAKQVKKAPAAKPKPPKGEGWECLFNGKDFTGWAAGRRGRGKGKIRWTVVDGTIDNDGKAGHSLWTQKQFADFTLHIEWRFKRTAGKYPMPIILPDGSYKKDKDGKVIKIPTPNADSGIFVRGGPQVNLWCWPCGSGELWSYRNNRRMPPEVRAGSVPKVKADKPVGQWNTFLITMTGERITVVLNGKTVIDNTPLPGIAPKGPIGLQHHGGPRGKGWSSATSFIQFRNIWVKRLKPAATKPAPKPKDARKGA